MCNAYTRKLECVSVSKLGVQPPPLPPPPTPAASDTKRLEIRREIQIWALAWFPQSLLPALPARLKCN